MLKRLSVVAALAIFAVSTATASASGGLPPSGKIWFGKNWNRSKSGDFVIVGKKVTFHAKENIAWVAHFNQQAGTKKITFMLFSYRNGKAKLIYHTPSPLQHANSNEKANKRPVADLIAAGANKVGIYVMEYVRRSHVLAAGAFNLIK